MIVFEERRGRHTLAAVRKDGEYYGTASVPGEAPQTFRDGDLARLKRRLRQSAEGPSPGYVGIDAAVRRFLAIFPGGFSDERYVRKERAHRASAARRLQEVLPLRSAAGAGRKAASAVREVFDVGILPEAELARVTETLSGAAAADFVNGSAMFAGGRYSEGLRAMESAMRPHGPATWPVVTYLAWLWLPEEHLLLRPAAICDFAARVGYDFAHDYEDGLFPDVYRSARDLSKTARDDLSRLRPADLIDVEGFIWVVTRYATPGQDPPS
jgi:hypothetical protein